MQSDEFLGVLPIGNPIPYTAVVERLHEGNAPPPSTWYHVTRIDRVGSIARLGLLPSCWFGGDCCCVFGLDVLDPHSYAKYGDWHVEVMSRAEAGTQLKAWWVPPGRIVGAWHDGRFYSRGELLALPMFDPTNRLLKSESCTGLCEIQYNLWETSVSAALMAA